jgi:hypothetical protein
METLDLDKLAPEPRKVKLGGKVIDVHPAKVKNLIAIQKLFLSFRSTDKAPEEQLKDMDKIIDVLRPIVPDIDSVDFTMEQLTKLLEFANSQEEVKKGAPNPT